MAHIQVSRPQTSVSNIPQCEQIIIRRNNSFWTFVICRSISLSLSQFRIEAEQENKNKYEIWAKWISPQTCEILSKVQINKYIQVWTRWCNGCVGRGGSLAENRDHNFKNLMCMHKCKIFIICHFALAEEKKARRGRKLHVNDDMTMDAWCTCHQ